MVNYPRPGAALFARPEQTTPVRLHHKTMQLGMHLNADRA
jgi:hypothetical protein